MKKTTVLLFFLMSAAGFSQNPLDKIKTYMNDNRSKFGLTNQDISDLVIVNEFSSESTGINNYHVKQRENGIEVYNSDSNFWIKNNNVINGGEDFIKNVSHKINTSTPSLNVAAAITGVLQEINNPLLGSTQILESNGHDYKLSNGNLTEDPIRAELVYFLVSQNELKLAWDCEFYSQDYSHLWSLKIDAVTGKLLEKRDLVISCNFGSNHKEHNHVDLISNTFTQSFLKDRQSSYMMTPGTTNYRVVPWNYESPNHSARQLVTNPENTTASPKGWHDTNALAGNIAAQKYSITRGNNVWARNDFAGTNSTTAPNGTSPTGTGTHPSLTFDFAYPGTAVAASTYIDAANTNLFYMNNIMHDLWYQYGFNEANKNFQSNNYARGGVQNDYVIADAQDGGQASPQNLNNANFSTQTDGISPRMQMYLWDVQPPFFTVNTPADIAGGKVARDNSFSPGHVNIPQAPAAITADLALFNDGVAPESDACTAAVNAAALNGKIVVMRRGDCSFAIKVKAAQNAGAVAAIIVNNVAGVVGMAGADATITIPAISVTMEIGEALITRMQTSTVNATLQKGTSFVNTDGDFDNGIIAHEYGHGISTRLSGNCLGSSEQQGEGWSDWFWLMMQIKPGDTRNGSRGIGTFAQNEPTNGNGIRQYKYSTDMAVNPHTFAATNAMSYTDANGDEQVNVHAVGSVWAVMLWDLAWNYIDKYGYDPNIYSGTGGNNKVMRLVLDAIKLDGCSPSFVSARDAIIAADQATTGGQDYCMIWKTFARRGLGINASSGTNSGADGIKDQVEDFTEPAPGPNCTLSADQFENKNNIRIYPNPSNGLINIRINSFAGVANLQIVDLNGRVVYSKENIDFGTEKAFNLNHLQSGIYVVKLNGDTINHTQKIVLE
ncbi:T9SS-dependent M36 family metallopeptidase [Flavobacterium amniphilum]|uniref:T9SS-dependent M36 family metallopeptidase n=1 Tax=Flavobacterium amniphilum TaxID=1834035 RepID=UPI00202A7EE1|nr:T9SS-dependent M36 family metallopeptidase [Flavobacterium amniphilum]MCL9804879.1 T9SS-dependent M36 family metallopeptidase [Flavobacterium amniphilum]